jgi:hypothetical protein
MNTIHPQTQLLRVKTPPATQPLMFGDFVAGVYHAWGQRKAKGIVKLAIKTHLIVFQGTERFEVS